MPALSDILVFRFTLLLLLFTALGFRFGEQRYACLFWHFLYFLEPSAWTHQEARREQAPLYFRHNH